MKNSKHHDAIRIDLKHEIDTDQQADDVYTGQREVSRLEQKEEHSTGILLYFLECFIV